MFEAVRTSLPRLATVAVVFALAAAWMPASAQPAIPGSATPTAGDAARDAALEHLLQGIDSDDFAVRERAAAALRSAAGIDLNTLIRRTGDHVHPLTAEQALRLNDIGVKMLKSSPRGAMGVSFARINSDSVEIGGAVEGFDAKRVLRAGDAVRTMSGVHITSHEEARAIILSHDPGDEVTLEIVRNGELSVVTLRLGSFNDLDNAYAIADPTIREAWRLRCARAAGGAAGDAEAPIETGITAAQYRAAQQRDRRQQQQALVEAQTNPRRRMDVGLPVVGGGALRLLDGEPDHAFGAAPAPEGDGVLAALRAQSINTASQIRQLEKQMREPRLNAVQRRELQALIRGQRSRQNGLRKQIAAQEKAGDGATADVDAAEALQEPKERGP